MIMLYALNLYRDVCQLKRKKEKPHNPAEQTNKTARACARAHSKRPALLPQNYYLKEISNV